MADYIKEISMKHISKRTTFCIIAIVLIIIATCAAYFAIANWRAQYSYNAATNSLIANINASKNVDNDKEVLLAQQQQTDAQFDEASSQNMLLLPQLSNRININAKISREFTKKLQNKLSNEKANLAANSNKNADKNKNNNQNKAQQESNKPQLNNNQKNKVENLLKQNNHVDSNDSQDEQEEGKVNKKTTNNGENSNKPW